MRFFLRGGGGGDQRDTVQSCQIIICYRHSGYNEKYNVESADFNINIS